MTRVVYRITGRGASPYHLYEDCNKLQQTPGAPKACGLDTLFEDADCCQRCVKRAIVYKEGCSRCDGPHELDAATLDAEMVEWECPEGGFNDVQGAAGFEQYLISVGLARADVRAVVDGIVAGGGERR